MENNSNISSRRFLLQKAISEFISFNENTDDKEVGDTHQSNNDGGLLVIDAEATEDSQDQLESSLLSREQIQEFTVAISMCSEGDDGSLHKDRLPELFNTLGYTVGEDSIQKLLIDFPPEPDTGLMSFGLLSDMYERWASDTMRTPDEMAELFYALAEPEVWYSHHTRKSGSSTGSRRTLRRPGHVNEVVMKALLRQVCHDPSVTLEDALAVIEEVDTDGLRHIDEREFALLNSLIR